jgi:hypothetical protein
MRALVLYDQIIGVLEVINKGGHFTQIDLELLKPIASCGAIAIQNTWLHEMSWPNATG